MMFYVFNDASECVLETENENKAIDFSLQKSITSLVILDMCGPIFIIIPVTLQLYNFFTKY